MVPYFFPFPTGSPPPNLMVWGSFWGGQGIKPILVTQSLLPVVLLHSSLYNPWQFIFFLQLLRKKNSWEVKGGVGGKLHLKRARDFLLILMSYVYMSFRLSKKKKKIPCNLTFLSLLLLKKQNSRQLVRLLGNRWQNIWLKPQWNQKGRFSNPVYESEWCFNPVLNCS